MSDGVEKAVRQGERSRFGSSDRTVEAWFGQRGEEIAYLGDRVRIAGDNEVSIYEVSFRKALTDDNDDLWLLKGYRDGELLIAFVYSIGLLTGVGTLAGLLRAGKLKWKPDDYPSKKIKQFLEDGLVG